MNKSTERFKKTIQEYLENKADFDPLFAETFKKEGKNIDDCITYILNSVEKSECNGFADEEIYSMAIHYYDEDNINIGNPKDMKCIVNHKVELTQEEIAEVKEKAVREIISETKRKATTKKHEPIKMEQKTIEMNNGKTTVINVPVKEEKPAFIQTSLF
jgi:hypothetical protein